RLQACLKSLQRPLRDVRPPRARTLMRHGSKSDSRFAKWGGRGGGRHALARRATATTARASPSRRHSPMYDNPRDRNARTFYFHTPSVDRQLAVAQITHHFRWRVRSAALALRLRSVVPSARPAACWRTRGHTPTPGASFWGWICDRERLTLVRSIPLLLAQH